jgi:ABC-type molybdate transport system permease subunit
MQISILLVAAVIIPCSILFGVALGVLAMLVIRFELAVRAQNDLWRSVEADLKNAAASLANKPVQWL